MEKEQRDKREIRSDHLHAKQKSISRKKSPKTADRAGPYLHVTPEWKKVLLAPADSEHAHSELA